MSETKKGDLTGKRVRFTKPVAYVIPTWDGDDSGVWPVDTEAVVRRRAEVDWEWMVEAPDGARFGVDAHEIEVIP